MTEKLSFQQTQQALAILLAANANPAFQKAEHFIHHNEVWQGVGFTIKPVTGLHAYHTAKAASDFFLAALGIAPTLIFEDHKFFGLRENKNGRIRLEFADLLAIEEAINRHFNPKIQTILQTIRTARLADEQTEAARIADEARFATEAARRNAETAAYRARRKGNPVIGSDRALVARNLCVVHATNFVPRLADDGTVEIDTTTTARQGSVFRNTIHVALNHKVAGHMQGNWEKMPYTVIGDFNATVYRNGPPDNLNTIDTFWTRGWNEPLEIPDALVVEPGELATGLCAVTTSAAIYKAKDFTLAEAAQLKDISGHYGAAVSITNDILNSDNCHMQPESPEQFWVKLENAAKQYPGTEFKSALHSMFCINAAQAIQIEQAFAATNNRHTIEKAIDHLGYHFYPGGGHCFDGSPDTLNATRRLAERLGVRFGTHFYSLQKDLERTVNWAIAQQENGGTVSMGCLTSLLRNPNINPRSQDVAIKVLKQHGIIRVGSNSQAWHFVPAPNRLLIRSTPANAHPIHGLKQAFDT